MLGSVVSPALALETKNSTVAENTANTPKLSKIVSLSKNRAEIIVYGEKYKILVDPVDFRTKEAYVVKVLNNKGEIIWSGVTNSNPIDDLIRDKSHQPRDIPIPPDANINIYPDKYSYKAGENGKVTIDVDNGGVTIGYTSYFILIPEGVEYNGVLDGPKPMGSIQLTDDNSCYIVPEYGVVCGKGTLLVWQEAVHLSGYKKTGCFECYVQQTREL